MTTAPTPEEVRAFAERLEHCVAKWGKQNALSLEAYSSVKMMRRLQAENERLRAELEARKPLSNDAIEEIISSTPGSDDSDGHIDSIELARAIERAHGIKESTDAG